MIHAGQKNFDYASIPVGYYDDVFHRAKGVQSAWHHLKFQQVRAAMPPDYRDHLDFGCGAGTFIATLPPNRRSIGVDIAQPQIDYAQQKYAGASHRFLCMDPAAPLPFEENTFDAVTMIEVIEHLPMTDNRRVLADALRVLRPGGRLIVTTPNYASLWPLLERVVNRLGDVSYEEQHISLFKRTALTRLLEDTGFDRVSVSTFQGLAPFIAGVGWRLAHAVHKIETPCLRFGLGFLLLGLAEKTAAPSAASCD